MEMIKCWPQTTKTLFFWDGAVDGSIPAGDTTATCNSVQCCVSWDLAILFLRAFRLVFVFVDKTHWMIKEADVNLYVKCYSVTASASKFSPVHGRMCIPGARPQQTVYKSIPPRKASFRWTVRLIDWYWLIFIFNTRLVTYHTIIAKLVSWCPNFMMRLEIIIRFGMKSTAHWIPIFIQE